MRPAIATASSSMTATVNRSSEGTPITPPPRRAPVVVVAEDHDVVRNPLVRILRHHGLDAREARNGLEAMALLESTDVDALVLDLMMPKMSGGQVLERVRADPRWASLPVVVMTGAFDSTMLTQARTLADRVLTKTGFDVDLLISTLRALLPAAG